MIGRRVPLAALVIILILKTVPTAARAGEEASQPLARITYVTSLSVYVDAGSEDGLEIGQVLEVAREGAVVATLHVTDVSPGRAVCSILDGGDATPTAGDAVRIGPPAETLPMSPAPSDPVAAKAPVAAGAAEYAGSGAPGAPGSAEAPGAPSPVDGVQPAPEEEASGSRSRRGVRGALRDAGLRGRVGLRYLAVKDRLEEGEAFSQPALDLRLDGTQVGGAPVDFSVDVRARRTYQDLPGGDTDRNDLNRVYSLSGSYRRPGSPWSATVGRQFSPSLAVINIFDGARVDYRARRWGAGAFSGTQPDEEDFGYDSGVREHGGYAEWRSAPEAERRWAVTGGLAGSYEEGEINREFSFLQLFYRGRRLFAWLSEEVDLNRGWKEEAGEDSVSLTSTFLSLSYRAGENWTLRGGYDNRRNVRLYRDRITPETEFDDAYRNGAWAGVDWRFARRFRFGLDLHTRGGGDLGGADSYTLTFGADRLTAADLDLRTRSTRYENDRVEGWLHSLSAGLQIGQRWHAALLGGLRDETNLFDSSLDDQVLWFGAEIDVLLGAGWYVSLSLERSDGDNEKIDQAYTSLAYRF